MISDLAMHLSEDESGTINLTGSDPDGDDLTFSIPAPGDANYPQHGTISILDNVVTYTPVADYNGTDPFSYFANDGGDGLSEATITASVIPVNDPPVVEDVVLYDVEDGHVFQLTATDVDGEIPVIQLLPPDGSAVFGGTVTDLGGGDYQYTIDINPNSGDVIFYTATDAVSESNVGQVEFNLIGGGGRIDRESDTQAIARGITITEDIATTLSLIGVDIGGDMGDDGILNFTEPDHGSISQPELVYFNANVAIWNATYTPPLNFTGDDRLTFNVTNPSRDGRTTSDNATISITVAPVNDPPTLDPIPTQFMDEDTELTITLNFSDPDNDLELTYDSSNRDDIVLSHDGNQLTLAPVENFYGRMGITVEVTEIDGDNQRASQSFNLAIAGVNDPPVVVPIGDIETEEETPVFINLSATDPDGDTAFTFTATTSDPDNVGISVEGNLLTINPGENRTGDVDFEILAFDENNMESQNQDFGLLIEDVNDAPSPGTVEGNTNIDEDGGRESVVLTLTPTDPDTSAILTVTVFTNNQLLFPPANISVVPAEAASGVERTITLTPAPDFSGMALIAIDVSDGISNRVQQVEVNVTPVNDAPVLTPIGDQFLTEDTALLVNLDASDIDNDLSELNFAVTSGENITATLLGMTLTLQPSADFNGSENFVISVSDGPRAVDTEEFSATVNPVNDAPEITSTAGTEAFTYQQYTYSVFVDDPDDTTLFYALNNEPTGMAVSVNGDITWTPSPGTSTSGTVTLTVSDDEGAFDTENFVISVTPTDCAGEVSGTAFIDDCDVCSGGTSGHASNSDKDCTGVCFGGAYMDNCDNCVAGSTGLDPCPQDCLGIWGGAAVIDECGECTGGMTGLDYNYLMDNCGVCDNDPSNDCIDDCLGVPGGTAYRDHCGVCDDDPATDCQVDLTVDINLDNAIIQLDLDNTMDVYYFQFQIVDEVNFFDFDNGFGGRASQNGFQVIMNQETGMVTAQHPSGGVLSPGSGLLTSIGFDPAVDNMIPPYGDERDRICVAPEDSESFITAINEFEIDFIGICSEQIPFEPGDLTMSGGLNISDAVLVIQMLLDNMGDPTAYQEWAADMNGSGGITVTDIVILIQMILGDDVARDDVATFADLTVRGNSIGVSSNGDVAGIQMRVNNSDLVLDSQLPEGWEIHRSPEMILLISMSGTLLEAEPILTTAEGLEIEEVIFSDWHGNEMSGGIVLLPTKYSLHTAYPNPFNGSTTLQFDILDEAQVSIRIYDVLGREVTQLVNHVYKPGYHQISWQAENQASGMYFVVMTAGEFSARQKIVLMK